MVEVTEGSIIHAWSVLTHLFRHLFSDTITFLLAQSKKALKPSLERGSYDKREQEGIKGLQVREKNIKARGCEGQTVKNQETGNWRDKQHQGHDSVLLDGTKVPVKRLDLVEEKPELVSPAYTTGSSIGGRRDRIYSLKDSWFDLVQLFLLVSESRSIYHKTKEHRRRPGFRRKI